VNHMIYHIIFAAYHTKTDAFEKRDEKGVIITIGDEEPRHILTKRAIKNYIGDDVAEDIRFNDLLVASGQMYKPFHITIAEGHYASRNLDRVKTAWQDYLGEQALVLKRPIGK